MPFSVRPFLPLGGEKTNKVLCGLLCLCGRTTQRARYKTATHSLMWIICSNNSFYKLYVKIHYWFMSSWMNCFLIWCPQESAGWHHLVVPFQSVINHRWIKNNCFGIMWVKISTLLSLEQHCGLDYYFVKVKGLSSHGYNNNHLASLLHHSIAVVSNSF